MEWLTNELVVQAITTFAVSGALVATINAVASRRKTHAESSKTHAEVGGVAASAAKEIGDTAVALMVPMREEIGRLAARVTELEAEVRAGQARERGSDSLLLAYTAWAQRATEKLSAAGIPIDPPPGMAPRGGT